MRWICSALVLSLALACGEDSATGPALDAVVLADPGGELPGEADEGTGPADEGAQPTDEGAQPDDEGPQPTDEGPQPTDEGPQPTDEGLQPSDEGPQPSDEGPQPTDPGPAEDTTGEDSPSADIPETTPDCSFDAVVGREDVSIVLLRLGDEGFEVLGSSAGNGMGGMEALAISGCHVYAALGQLSVMIYDASDVTAPEHLASYGDLANAVHIDVDGTLAAVAGMDEGAHLLDVSDPAAPVRLAEISTPTPAEYVAVDGDRLFILDDIVRTVLFAYDVSDPANPQLTGEWHGGINYHPKGMVLDREKGWLFVSGGGCGMGMDGVICSSSVARLDARAADLPELGRVTLEAGEEGSMVAGPIALTESGSVTVWNSDKGLSLYTGEGLQLLETPLMPAWKPRQMAGKEHALLVATEQHELKLVRVMLLGDAPNLEEVTVEGVQGTVRAVAFR